MLDLLTATDAEIARMVRSFAQMHENGQLPKHASLLLYTDGSGCIQTLDERNTRRRIQLHDYYDGDSWFAGPGDPAERERRTLAKSGLSRFWVDAKVEGAIPLDDVIRVARLLRVFAVCACSDGPTSSVALSIYAATSEEAAAMAHRELRSWGLQVETIASRPWEKGVQN